MRQILGIALFISIAVVLSPISHSAGLDTVRQGPWVLLFAVAPGCAACEEAIAWMGEAADTHRGINALLVGPSLTDELEEVSRTAGLRVVADRGGVVGAGLGVVRAPTLISLLDGELLSRLDWPFVEDTLIQRMEDLAATPRGGPWQFLGATISLGVAIDLNGEPVDLDHRSGPLLLLFFSSECPACREDLATLIALSEEIKTVLVVMTPSALSMKDKRMLRQVELKALVDDQESLAQALAIRVAPTYVLLNSEGRVCWVKEGSVEADVLRDSIIAALHGE